MAQNIMYTVICTGKAIVFKRLCLTVNTNKDIINQNSNIKKLCMIGGEPRKIVLPWNCLYA